MPRHRNSSRIRAHQNRMHSKPVKNYGPSGRVWKKGARYIASEESGCVNGPATAEEIAAREAAKAKKEANRNKYEAETIICQECGQTWSYLMLSEPFCGNCGSGELVDITTGEKV